MEGYLTEALASTKRELLIFIVDGVLYSKHQRSKRREGCLYTCTRDITAVTN